MTFCYREFLVSICFYFCPPFLHFQAFWLKIHCILLDFWSKKEKSFGKTHNMLENAPHPFTWYKIAEKVIHIQNEDHSSMFESSLKFGLVDSGIEAQSLNAVVYATYDRVPSFVTLLNVSPLDLPFRICSKPFW